MAAPASANPKNLTGKWSMNKSLSGDTDGTLALQGISWLTRKAVSIASVTLHLKQYTDDSGVVHIDIDQILTAGLKGTREERTLDNSFRGHEDHIFGEVKGRSTFEKVGNTAVTELGDEDKKFLAEGFEEGLEEVVEGYVENEKAGWKAIQHWGFEVVEGERKFVRHTIVWNASDKKMIKIVYDYAGEL